LREQGFRPWRSEERKFRCSPSDANLVAWANKGIVWQNLQMA